MLSDSIFLATSIVLIIRSALNSHIERINYVLNTDSRYRWALAFIINMVLILGQFGYSENEPKQDIIEILLQRYRVLFYLFGIH